MKYDIFEDICFERYIDKAFDACHGSYNVFFDEIEKIGRCIYRRYQIWISNKLFVQEAREKFVYTLLTDNSIEAKWKKQTEIGIVKSKYCGLFFKEFQELLDETVVEELLDITNLYAFEAKINHSPALIMNVTPIGAARENLIGMVFEERISLDKNRTSIIKLCDDYANCFYKTADTEEKAYKIIMIEPQIKGEAQKIVKNNEDANEPILQLNKIINHLLEDINDKKANAGQVITVIDILCEKMKDDYRIEMQFEKVLVTFIASALIMCDITDEQRNKLVEEWIKRVKKIFSNQSYVAEVNMVIVLWEQLNKNINNDLKKQILIMILESIVNDEKSGLISQLAELTYYFLGKNRNYASRVFNTIIMLAEDEMNHQKFNAVYIKNHNDAEYEFIPNMVPKLRGVDYWIRENKGNEYQNKRSEIIQEYLYDGKGGDLSEFDISNYDIDLLCNIACCGLDTEDEEFAIVISSIVQCMIEIWHKNCKEMRAHEIIDTFQEHKVSSYFQRELNIIGRNPEAVYDILFKRTDFSIFTRDTLDFYEDVLSGFLVSYVDGFREKGKRDDIEKKIRILETYVNSIPEDYVRNILEADQCI